MTVCTTQEAIREFSLLLISKDCARAWQISIETNAFKYAFPGDRAGLVEVAVQAKGPDLTITVTVDGVGCPSDANDGLGTRLIKLLAAQMKGAMTRRSLPKGCQVQIIIALDT
jgi:two-component sensor histidine kinase